MNPIKSSALFKLLIIQCLSVLCLSQDFDFFYFVQQWPGSYCDTCRAAAILRLGSLQKISVSMGYGQTAMMEHGHRTVRVTSLFDESEIFLVECGGNGLPLSCPSSNGVRFWTHEWEKHGTCSLLSQHQYFQTALDLKEKSNLLQVLKDAGIVPNGEMYSVESIKDAIKEGVGYTPFIECNVDRSHNHQLYQVYLCVDSSASDLIECPVFPHGRCGSEIEFPSFCLVTC